jgi:hypothetical protein
MNKHKWKRQATVKKPTYGGESRFVCEICDIEMHTSFACLPTFGCIERKINTEQDKEQDK